MNNFIFIKVENNINRFINKCKVYDIDLHSITYLSKDIIVVKILKKHLKNIKRYNYFSNISIYKKTGIDNILDKIYKEKYLIILFIICLISMYLISNIILKIEVIHSNKNIRDLLYSELKEYGIKKYSYKKNFNELENIKNNILKNNKDTLEWISITNIGMKYIIRVEERIIDNIKKDNDYCNIISTKDALITKIQATKGDILVKTNDYVRKDDTLISGDLILNEEIKDTTCAKGTIYGKVWYNTNISLKESYIKKEYTGKKRYNISILNKTLKKIKYSNYDKKYIIKNKYFSLYKELEYKNNEYIYNKKNGIQKALKELENKFNNKLSLNGKILEKKILNQTITDSTITINVFVVTEEIISKQIIE